MVEFKGFTDDLDDETGDLVLPNPADLLETLLRGIQVAFNVCLQENFARYFASYGEEVTDSVMIHNKLTGRLRGFGFVTFADPAVADIFLGRDHIIDGKPLIRGNNFLSTVGTLKALMVVQQLDITGMIMGVSTADCILPYAYGAHGNFGGSRQRFYCGYGGYPYGFVCGRSMYGDAGFGAMLRCYGGFPAHGSASNGYRRRAVSLDSCLASGYHPITGEEDLAPWYLSTASTSDSPF